MKVFRFTLFAEKFKETQSKAWQDKFGGRLKYAMGLQFHVALFAI